MQFQICEIKQSHGYTFLFGSESLPTSRLREQIGGALAGVWANLFEGEKESFSEYGFELVPDNSPPTGEKELPTMTPGSTYLVFVLLESESGSAVGGEEITRGIHRAIETSVSSSRMKPGIGVIALYNCSVQILESKHYVSWDSIPPEAPKRSRWASPGEDSFGRWP